MYECPVHRRLAGTQCPWRVRKMKCGGSVNADWLTYSPVRFCQHSRSFRKETKGPTGSIQEEPKRGDWSQEAWLQEQVGSILLRKMSIFSSLISSSQAAAATGRNQETRARGRKEIAFSLLVFQPAHDCLLHPFCKHQCPPWSAV